MKKKSLVMIVLLFTLFVISPLITVPATRALPGVIAFFDDLEGFNAAADFPPVVVDFDDIIPGTDITGTSIRGVLFELGSAPSAQLIVVRGIDTYSGPGFDWSGPDNRLFATTGENVLSPGGVELAPGPNPLLENDDLNLTLLTPVSAIGFDILYQSMDGYSCTAITLLDAEGNMLYHNDLIPIPSSPGGAGGASFVGFVSDSSNIAKIVIDEYDDNNINPDSNIGFDTIRFGISATITVHVQKRFGGAPIEGVNVTIYSDSTQVDSALTDMNGDALFQVPAGIYTIVAKRHVLWKIYLTKEETVTITEDTTVTFTFLF